MPGPCYVRWVVSSSHTILFSGGGTAGHLAPGFALASALEEAGHRCPFATPGEPVERSWFHGRPPPEVLHARRLPRSARAALGYPFHLLRGVRQARRLLRREQVDAVVALGGWPCAPAVLAARWSRTPLVFLVPDAVPGVLVRRFARWAQRLYLASDAARPSLEPHPGLVVSGPLLQSSILEAPADPQALGLHADRLTLLVTGGSLGARALNERFLAGLTEALADDPTLGERIQVLHSAGSDQAAVAARYRDLPVPHVVTAYIEDMGRAYRTADLVLARAGANTCAELEALGRPTVFVPYPHHADRQQFLNAQPLVERGAARLVEEADLSPERVRQDVLGLLLDAEARGRMEAAATARDKPAGAAVATDLIRLLEETRSPKKEA